MILLIFMIFWIFMILLILLILSITSYFVLTLLVLLIYRFSLMILHEPHSFLRRLLLYFFRMAFDRYFIVGLALGLLRLRLLFKFLRRLRMLHDVLVVFAVVMLVKPKLRGPPPKPPPSGKPRPPKRHLL